jgi:hypothetical protein
VCDVIASLIRSARPAVSGLRTMTNLREETDLGLKVEYRADFFRRRRSIFNSAIAQVKIRFLYHGTAKSLVARLGFRCVVTPIVRT